MRYLSTRGGAETDLVGAVMEGLAPDGGLYVPEALPRFSPDLFRGETLAQVAAELLAPFFAGSPLEDELASICREAFNFPVPLRALPGTAGKLCVLELFHGPTAAFKDFGARFLAAVMERVLRSSRDKDGRPLTILVATSGDTGGAVAAAFHGRLGVRVAVLFPKGQVSPRQQHQLTCWGENVRAFEVDGTFDECQAVLKQAFLDETLAKRVRLSAANSINMGRLLPQVAYHAAAALRYWREHREWAGSIVPTGNLGNGMACIWARAMGLPIREVVLAVNANRTIPDFLSTGEWRPRASVRTLASAMDVGNPSNMERLRSLMPDTDALRNAVKAYAVDDESIRAQIAKDDRRYHEVWCPHTATGFWVHDHLEEQRRSKPWIVSATAHPAKFETIVEPIVGREVAVPPALAALLDRPTAAIPLEPRLQALAEKLIGWT
ncbi:MAG TPA: threonine synthase [Gammaproteobacteria bacterium]|nr:threonine synthase [Gammaproteobacteria bacterium]